jgi:hypothetical protein
VTKEQIKSAPNIEQHGEELSQADGSALYHHYELNYTPPNNESGRRLPAADASAQRQSDTGVHSALNPMSIKHLDDLRAQAQHAASATSRSRRVRAATTPQRADRGQQALGGVAAVGGRPGMPRHATLAGGSHPSHR